MKIVGITGPTGAGKSSLSSIAKDMGFTVVNCDILSRKAVEKGTEGLKSLISVFGEDILNNDGLLNRKCLAKKAFSTKENTELLNKTLLPHIVKLVESACIGDNVLLDAPTLFESGLNVKCDATIGVLADKNIRFERICQRDSITAEQAILRINAGKPDEFYIENADFIIYNNGSTVEFQKDFADILKEIKER